MVEIWNYWRSAIIIITTYVVIGATKVEERHHQSFLFWSFKLKVASRKSQRAANFDSPKLGLLLLHFANLQNNQWKIMYNAQWLQNTKNGSFEFSCQTIKFLFLLFSNTYFNFHLICGGTKLILTSRFLLQIFYKKVEIGFCFSSSSFIPETKNGQNGKW